MILKSAQSHSSDEVPEEVEPDELYDLLYTFDIEQDEELVDDPYAGYDYDSEYDDDDLVTYEWDDWLESEDG